MSKNYIQENDLFVKTKQKLKKLQDENGGYLNLESTWVLPDGKIDSESYQFIDESKIYNVFNIRLEAPVKVICKVLHYNSEIEGQNLVIQSLGTTGFTYDNHTKSNDPSIAFYLDEDVLEIESWLELTPNQPKAFLQIYNAWLDEEGFVDSLRNSAYFMQILEENSFLLRVNVGTTNSVFQPIDFDDLLILLTMEPILGETC